MILKFNTFVSAIALGSAVLSPFANASGEKQRFLKASDPKTAIAGQYIVKLKKEEEVPDGANPAMYEENVDGDLVRTKEALLDFCGGTGGKPLLAYQDAFYGCSVSGISKETAMELAADPAVERVEQDSTVTIDNVGSWGLDRVDQRNLPLSGSFSPRSDGSGITAYILDTGILHAHEDFEGRAEFGANFMDDDNTEDCNGHGTHVASTTGGVEYGVAKGVTLVSVKVLGCSGGGSWTGVIGGLDWAKADASGKIGVANMSLGGSFISSVNDAVASLRDSGVPVAVAAGNGSADACGYSPASEPKAITVGSTEDTDQMSGFSNFGTCLDIFAPGTSIKAAWWTSTTATNTISGTSMASPHVCGGLAIAMEETNGDLSLSEAMVLNTATSGVVTGIPAVPASPNEFLYVGVLNPTTSPTPGPPTAAPTPCMTGNISIEVQTDQWPSETTWELVDLCDGNTTVIEGGPYDGGFSVYTHHYCAKLAVGVGSYMFTVFDTYGDGILDGNYTVMYDDVIVVEGGGDFGTVISHEIEGTCEPPSECEDSPLKFKFDTEDGKSKFTKCKDMDLAWCNIGKNDRSCPKSCGTCDKCKDSKNKFKTNDWNGKKRKKTCKDVDSEKNCGYEGIAETCRDTCSEWVDGLC